MLSNEIRTNNPLLPQPWILPVIVLAQFFCTSVWFAGNAVLPDIIRHAGLEDGALANLTSAVQFGFISGTFIFAALAVADRFSPSRIFFCCAVLSGLANLGICLPEITAASLMFLRFSSGFFLAGIYPVGMKISSDYYDKGLGKSLGLLVGALVLGTAFPHLLRSMTTQLPWEYVIWTISALSITGGFSMVLFVPDGPYRKAGQGLNPKGFVSAFRDGNFRAAAFGYFGHMWELYTFWAFVPFLLEMNMAYNHTGINVPLSSFYIIASGSLACVVVGFLSVKSGAKRIATIALGLSGLCCLLSPLFVLTTSFPVLFIFLLFWGMVVVADSPLFSTLVAQNVPDNIRGTSLTIVNCIGFAITIVSIQLFRMLAGSMSIRYIFLLLAIGPVFGLIALLRRR